MIKIISISINKHKREKKYTCKVIYEIYMTCNIYIYIYIYIAQEKFRLKKTWRLTKAIAERKCDTEQTMKLE